MTRRPWTPAELTTLRRSYRSTPTADLAHQLGRSPSSVYQAVARLGLCRGRFDTGPEFRAELARLHADGLTDSEIAGRFRCDRKTVSNHRRALGLSSNRAAGRYRRRVAAATRRQCAAAGVGSLGAVRALAFRRRAIEAGWPADLRPREVQMLDALAANGPMTRREIAGALGMEWHGSRRSLRCKGGRGSYLANLQARGLVVALGKVVRGKGSGFSVNLYSLSLNCEKREIV